MTTTETGTRPVFYAGMPAEATAGEPGVYGVIRRIVAAHMDWGIPVAAAALEESYDGTQWAVVLTLETGPAARIAYDGTARVPVYTLTVNDEPQPTGHVHPFTTWDIRAHQLARATYRALPRR